MGLFIYPTIELKLTGKTLIVPVVSTANVSQLAVDLLISSFSLNRLAICNAEFLVPVAGGREDGGVGVATPLELYGKDGMDLLVMQQRSPVLKSRKQEFVAALLDFFKTSGVGSVIFLSGVESSNRTDSQMSTTVYQVQPPNSPSLTTSSLRALNSLQIPAYMSPVLQRPHSSQEDATIPFIPGGGLTRRILASLPNQWAVATAALLQFVQEGDNRADAGFLATVAAKVVGLDSSAKGWSQPNSWKQGLFGASHDQTLYG